MQSAAQQLFRQPVAIDPQRHARAGVLPTSGFEFAAGLTAIPLGFEELGDAAAHVPLIFLQGQPHGLYGVRAGHNLFVSSDGRWRQGAYVPLLLRHYPFQVLTGPGLPVLAVDEAADGFRSDGGEPLFERGEPSVLARAALEACLRLMAELVRSEGFGRAIFNLGLLSPLDLRFELADGERLTLSGAQQIDPAAFFSLSDEALIGLRRQGFLDALYAARFSAGRWDSLMQMAGVAAR